MVRDLVADPQLVALERLKRYWVGVGTLEFFGNPALKTGVLIVQGVDVGCFHFGLSSIGHKAIESDLRASAAP
ncbi:hypothetical protein GGR38_002395 [Novosphingobium sediminicola]|uniref:Uncharacterized protein n=1 Tax=Novosphingobium sediminicola TaxID=563162 RepID=A0A7W6CF70_9SPHN|nr:hypothetical protein [Novosphingobium sediminicola]